MNLYKTHKARARGRRAHTRARRGRGFERAALIHPNRGHPRRPREAYDGHAEALQEVVARRGRGRRGRRHWRRVALHKRQRSPERRGRVRRGGGGGGGGWCGRGVEAGVHPAGGGVEERRVKEHGECKRAPDTVLRHPQPEAQRGGGDANEEQLPRPARGRRGARARGRHAAGRGAAGCVVQIGGEEIRMLSREREYRVCGGWALRGGRGRTDRMGSRGRGTRNRT
jgi:hypothetical protein